MKALDKRRRSRCALAVGGVLSVPLLSGLAAAQTDSATPNRQKPRTVVMHDPELDDLNTLIRYLLYSNQFETEGLVYASSRVHWKGDGTPFDGPGEHQRIPGLAGPITSWRWDEDTRFIEEAIDVYAGVYPNLSIHAEGFPKPEDLRSRIYVGNVTFPGDYSGDTDGSNLIKGLLLDESPGPIYLLTGAGQSTIAAALRSIAEEHADTPAWPEIYEEVSAKAIIQSFGDQDGVYAAYIGPSWPDIEFREMSTRIWGYGARSAVLATDREYLSASWIRANVSSIGPFGDFYRVWGDGKQMHKGDLTDFFGFAGLTRAQLTELGYWVWLGSLEEAGSWISEGDTSMYMNLLDNGLSGHVDTSYGGWGGRNGRDIEPGTGMASKEYAAARWFGTAQRDFAARLRWTVTPEYGATNHNPVVAVLSPTSSIVAPGEIVTLTARVIDPDGDHVTGRWWQYEEADTYPGTVELTSVGEEPGVERKYSYPATVPAPGSSAVAAVIDDEIDVTSRFTVPPDAVDGQTLHLIVEASDNGAPYLSSYQRVVLTVTR